MKTLSKISLNELLGGVATRCTYKGYTVIYQNGYVTIFKDKYITSFTYGILFHTLAQFKARVKKEINNYIK